MDKSFPLTGVPVDTTNGRRCETCRLWQIGVSSPWNPDRNRCACPVPASVKKFCKHCGQLWYLNRFTDAAGASDSEYVRFIPQIVGLK